ncbi:MAG: 50S ribosomal protein L17 [Patescibacteria group bacterium]
MRKKIFGKKLSRGRGSREALFRSLTRALVLVGKIETTKAKAKAVVSYVDKTITWVKKDNLIARRMVLARLGNDREIAERLFAYYLPLVGKRTSGFTRTVNLPRRVGDRAQMVYLEWVDKPAPVVKKAKNENISA